MPGTWDDLRPRLASALILGSAGLAAIYLGGVWFEGLVIAIGALMVWEITVIAGARHPLPVALTAVPAVLGFVHLPAWAGLPLLALPALAGIGHLARVRVAHAVFCTLIVLAAGGLVDLRESFAPVWLAWLLVVVLVTDVAGYFAGRRIGGPKFWPALSPKKTWSGTAAGWAAAALAGLVFLPLAGAGALLVALSVALSMAAQAGDMAESALKRAAGVKDSSRLLPGHGGFFDRFDGILGASLFLMGVTAMTGFPPQQA